VICQRFVHVYTGRSCILLQGRGKGGHLEAATAERRRGRVKVDASALRRLREGYPLTVRELAERSGVSHNTITMIENRHRTANPSTVRKLAAALGVESGELMWKETE
jgi:DNA-binding XRE family transcriptional regulator